MFPMKHAGIWLELSFYCPERVDADTFAELYLSLLRTGASTTGFIAFVEHSRVRNQHFQLVSDFESVQYVQVNQSEILAMLNDSNVKVLRLEVSPARNLSSNASTTWITYQGIRSDSDNHPIALLVDGEVFDSLESTTQRSQFDSGDECASCFHELICHLNPRYASITVEYALECFRDLGEDPRSLAFQDFYLGNRYLSPQQLSQVMALTSSIYKSKLPHGWYFSTHACFNPHRFQFDPSLSMDLSAAIARILCANAGSE